MTIVTYDKTYTFNTFLYKGNGYRNTTQITSN